MTIRELVREMTLKEKAGLCSGRDFWHTKAVERLGIPSLMMCDGPHGLRKQEGEGDHLGINVSIETVCYPTASALAASFDREALRTLGTALGQECRAEEVAMLLGPGLNMKRSPLCGRNFEYFSEDPYLAGGLGAAYVSGLQAQGVAACVKHFAANNQETRRMSGSSEMDERTLREIYLPAFEAAVKKGGAQSIMCAYNAINGTFCSENKQLLTEILRDEWGFSGFVVTDWGAVKDRVKGLEAGLDLEMPGGPGAQDDAIVQAVESGRLDEKTLDRAVENLLRWILRPEHSKRSEKAFDRTAAHALSGKLAARCAVLLKNDRDMLPLKRDGGVVFTGEFADVPRYQGAGSSHINTLCVTSAREAAGAWVSYARGYDAHSAGTDPRLLREAVDAAKNAQAVVVFAGLPDSFETEGCDRETLSLPANQNELIEAVAAVNPNVAVVLHGGGVMELPWIDRVRAVLCMHLGGCAVGEAAVRLLFGEENPGGKLAETWPLRLEDTPSYLNFPGEEGIVRYAEDIFIGYRYYDKKKMPVLFPFGHGLSSTRFAYSALSLSAAQINDSEALSVSCRVKNTGGVPGSEAVQLYVGDVESTVRRPVRELKGFERVDLLPGEEKIVSFTLDKRAFAYYEPKIHDWFVESGEFRIEVGASSRDIRLSDTVTVAGTTALPVVYTRLSPVADLAKTPAGRSFLGELAALRGRRDAAKLENAGVETMGEGSEKMMRRMMEEMPLSNLVTYGVMTADQLDSLLARLNESPLSRSVSL